MPPTTPTPGPLAEVLTWAVDRLRAAGATATWNAADLSLPGLWITPDGVELPTLDGTHGRVQLVILAVSAGTERQADLAALDHLLTTANRVLHVRTWRPDTITLPNHSPDPLLALRGELTIEWSPTP